MRARILSFLLLLPFLLLSCKVVVEDPYGNRLGSLDSVNLDSLTRLSSWLHPYSSWSPYSSSSATVGSSSATATCAWYSEKVYTVQTIYTWQELYADGNRVTRFSLDTIEYPGVQSKKLSITEYTSLASAESQQSEPLFTFSYRYICPGDDALNYLDSNGIIDRGIHNDTTYLNYGPSARDSLVTPEVHILNPESLLVAFASISQGDNSVGYPLQVTHFNADSIRLTLHAPQWISLWSNKPTLINTYNSCSDTVLTVSYQGNAFINNNFLLVGISDSTMVVDSTVTWEILVRNRFGFRDVVKLSTTIDSTDCFTVMPYIIE